MKRTKRVPFLRCACCGLRILVGEHYLLISRARRVAQHVDPCPRKIVNGKSVRA